MQGPPDDFGGKWRNPTAPTFESHSAGAGPSRALGLGCGAFSLLSLLGGGITLALLVTRVLKRTFHLRHKTADMIGVSSLVLMGLGLVGLVIASVLVATSRKKQ